MPCSSQELLLRACSQVPSKVSEVLNDPNQTEDTCTHQQNEPAQLPGNHAICPNNQIPHGKSLSLPGMCNKAVKRLLHKSLRHPCLHFSCLPPVAGETSEAEAQGHTADFMHAVCSNAASQAMAALWSLAALSITSNGTHKRKLCVWVCTAWLVKKFGLMSSPGAASLAGNSSAESRAGRSVQGPIIKAYTKQGHGR